jgi:predicted transcriptional regulator
VFDGYRWAGFLADSWDIRVMENTSTPNEGLVELTAEIVSAYVTNNPVPVAELPALIESVHRAISNLKSSANEVQPEPDQKPAVNPKRSVQDDHIVCLEDGLTFKSLKRHLATHHGITPEEYRLKWKLPADYPMVAPIYAKARSEMAKSMGLGRKAGVPVKRKSKAKPA